MKVYFDTDAEVIVVEGAQEVYPPKSLMAVATANKVTIWLADSSTQVYGGVPFGRIQTKDGNSFTNWQETLDYLNGEFAKPTTDYALLVLEGLL